MTESPRIVLVDTWYPDVIREHPVILGDLYGPKYQFQMKHMMDVCFGTSNFYSTHLSALGWHAIDLLVNHRELQELWCREHDRRPDTLERMAIDQVDYYEPHVIFLQDLSFFSVAALRYLRTKAVVAGQCSCPFPDPDKVRECHVLFSSFPHYLDRFAALGVKSVFLPLAFDDHLLNRIKGGDRVYDVSFVGGVGTPSHWAYGMRVLETVARSIPTAKYWGYGFDLLPAGAVKARYQGPAWGLDMYSVLAQSKIFLNRHGEVAENYANNMKLFEATGCAAMLLTEEKDNIRDYFSDKECVTYRSPEDAVEKIRYYLAHDLERQKIALAGQRRTLEDHTYSKRMPVLSKVLKDFIASRAA